MLKGWKTLIAGVLIAGLGTVEATDLVDVVPPEYNGVVLAVIGLLMVWLRKVTTTPIGKKETPDA